MCPLVDWYAVFFEACKDKSPTGAGVDLFGLSYSISLVAIVAGVVVKKTGKYVITTFVGWVLMIVGAGLLTTLHADSSLSKSVGFQLVVGGGVGIIYVVTLFPILASIPVTQSAPAMALYVFSRNFGYVSTLFPLPSVRSCTDDPKRVDLGRHRGRRHTTKRAEEKVTRLLPRAVPTRRRDCVRDDSDHPDATAAVQGRSAEHLCRRTQGRLAGRAWHRDRGVPVQSGHAAVATSHEDRRGLG